MVMVSRHRKRLPRYRTPQKNDAMPVRFVKDSPLWTAMIHHEVPWHFLNFLLLPHQQGSFRLNLTGGSITPST